MTFFNKIFQIVWKFSIFTYFRSTFGISWSGVCLVVHGFWETFALVSTNFVHSGLSTNLYSCLAMEILYFLHLLDSLEKLKKWYTFKSCTRERFWSLNSGSVLPLVRNLSLQFVTTLINDQFFLYLCGVSIYGL